MELFPVLQRESHLWPTSMDSSFTPDAGGLATIAQLFTDYSVPGANHVQIYVRLQQCSSVADFNSYLAHLLSQATARRRPARRSSLLNKTRSVGSASGSPPVCWPAA